MAALHARWSMRLAPACLLGWLSGIAAAPLVVEVRDEHGKPLQDVAVWAERQGDPAASPRHDGAPARIDQRARTFIPYVTVVQTGTAIEFPNNDTIRHHVYSFSPAKVFSLKLYLGTPAEPVLFDKPGEVVLGCNIHDHMVAYVYVVDTPHFAVTGSDGRVRLDGLAPGSWRLSVRQPGMPAPERRQLEVDAAGQASAQQFRIVPAGLPRGVRR